MRIIKNVVNERYFKFSYYIFEFSGLIFGVHSASSLELCGWSGWPRLHLNLMVTLPPLHFSDIVDSFSDLQRWINSIREANMKPASEFPSITGAISLNMLFRNPHKLIISICYIKSIPIVFWIGNAKLWIRNNEE